MITHVDETGAPCVRHPAASEELMFQLALVGSRASAFHHDCASKLQSLVMALDEISELVEGGDPSLLRALDTAQTSTRELHALLNASRALAKPPARTTMDLRELVARSAERVGVAIRGPIPELTVNVSLAAMTQALALAIDAAAGPGRGRRLELTGSHVDGHAVLALATAAVPSPSAGESLAIATFVIARDGGALHCQSTQAQIVIRLPNVTLPP